MARKPETGKTPDRRGRGFRTAGDSTRATVKQVAGDRGIAQADILLRWREIVGEALSGHCLPVKVTYGANKSLGATLTVQTDSGRAPEITHKQTVIIEQINRYYGYRAIGRLKVTQSTGMGRAHGFAEDQATFEGPSTEPTAPQTREAAALTEGIESPGLRAALTRMGANVLAQSRAGRGSATKSENS